MSNRATPAVGGEVGALLLVLVLLVGRRRRRRRALRLPAVAAAPADQKPIILHSNPHCTVVHDAKSQKHNLIGLVCKMIDSTIEK